MQIGVSGVKCQYIDREMTDKMSSSRTICTHAYTQYRIICTDRACYPW